MDILENVRKLIESEDVVAIQGFLQDGKGMLKEEACTQLDSRQIKKLKRDGLAESFVPSLPRLTLAENETVNANAKELMLNSKEISTSKPLSKLTASSKCVIQSTISFPVRENSKIKGNSSSTSKSSKDPKESLAKAVADDPKSSSPLTLQRPKETQGNQFLLRRKTTQYQVSVDASANNVPESSCSKNPYDIGEISKLVDKLSDEEKYHHLISVWIPDENFVYKTRVIFGKCRKFNKDWLHLYNWLTYSKELDGAFCIPCVFFGRRIGINASKMEKLMKCPVTDWSSSKNKLNLHSLKSDVHKTALLTMQSFMDVMEQKKKSIIRVQSSAIDQKIITNRRKLASFIKSVLFLAQHNIPFRGHRDDSKYHGSVECGNFQALLDFRVDSGDATLKEHFESAPRNATYRSKTTQNEMITCCADLVNEDMIKEIKECGIYSILVDEVTDCANKEQMPLVPLIHRSAL